MTESKTQNRGHCPCCGREQAVMASGRMSKHGYQVKDGWFSGVCNGDSHPPIEVSREAADMIVAQVRAQVAELRAQAQQVRDGKLKPRTVRTGRQFRGASSKWEEVVVPFAEAPSYQQEGAVRSLERSFDRRADLGDNFADCLERLANEHHGKPLRTVKVEAGPAPILAGERRTLAGGDVATASRVEGARVYWTRGEKGFKGWTGTQAWRKLPLA